MNQPCPPAYISATSSPTPRMHSARAPALTGSIWKATPAMRTQIAPTTPGTMVPGWNSSSMMPITPSMAMRYAICGSASACSTRSRMVHSTVRSSAPAVCSRRVSPPSCTSRPSIFRKSSGTSSATRSITFSRSASVAVIETLSRTAFSAQSTLRERRSAMPCTKAAVSFSIFFSIVSTSEFFSTPPPPMPTGCAAPMLLDGAMAATWAASVMNTPAEPARAPGGPTHTTTGTLADSSAWTMSRVDASSPPGVSMRIRTASAPCASASWMASIRYRAEPGSTEPDSSA